MSISDKIKAINNKLEQNKGQYDLDSQTAKVPHLSSKTFSKYKFLNGKEVVIFGPAWDRAYLVPF